MDADADANGATGVLATVTLLTLLAASLATACTFIEDSRGAGGMAVLGDAASGPPLEGVTRLDHELWTVVLASYVTPTGVACGALGASAEDPSSARTGSCPGSASRRASSSP